MQRHPEGGWYKEFYRSSESIPHKCLPSRFNGDRNFSTAIYYLLDKTDFSAFHQIQQDELWHFYDGTSLTIHIIDATDQYSTVQLGRNTALGERPLAIVEAGSLFGATVNDVNSYTLVGCTVAPGFSFDDFDMPDREQLLGRYPQHRDIILQLSKET